MILSPSRKYISSTSDETRESDPRMQHTTIQGRIRYTSKKQEMLDQRRGGETFTYTIHPDGMRILRAHCCIYENSPRVVRESVTTLDNNWVPRYGFVQITVDAEFVGSSWFRFTDSLAECEGYTVKQGRFSQSMDIEVPPAIFSTHPIQSDAMNGNLYPLEKGPGSITVPLHMMSSFNHRGADGPMLLFRENPLEIHYLGKESVEVEAGKFDALHFRFNSNDDDNYMGTDKHPPYHAWVTADGDFVMLKAHCTGYMQTYYELVEYEKTVDYF